MAAGYGLAEIYVLRKLHKEKMKAIEGEERSVKMQDTNATFIIKEEKTSGCFFWPFMYKKVHPRNSREVAFAGKDRAVEIWDNKG